MIPGARHSESAHGLRVNQRVGGRSARLTGVLAGTFALALFTITCSRGVEWQDSGIHQYRILTGWLEHPLGLALSHPLHYWAGRVLVGAGSGDPLLMLNLMSAFFGAVGVGVLAGVVTAFTRRSAAGWLAAATLALSHSYWQMSALTETYTLAAALMMIEWACLFRYVRTQHPVWLITVFFVNGLHVADHLLGLLTLATYGTLLLVLLIRRRLALGWLPLAAALWFLAASPYLALLAGHYQHTHDLAGTVRSALFGGGALSQGWSQNVLNTRLSASQLKLATLTFGYCFPSLAGLVALAGIVSRTRGRRRVFRWVLIAQTVIICVFVGRYTIKDLYTYFVPVCVLTAFWFGLGVAWLLRRCRTTRARRTVIGVLAAQALVPVVVYWAFPIVAQRRGLLRDQLRDLPFRNEYRHFFRPWRCCDDSPERFAREALAQTGENGWLLAGSTTGPMVAAVQHVRGGPPEARVYWWRMCLTDRTAPDLTDEALRRHIEQGGGAVGAPAPEVQNVVRQPLVIDRTTPFWRIRLPARE